MRYENRADLLIDAGESIKMQEKAGIEPVFKNLQIAEFDNAKGIRQMFEWKPSYDMSPNMYEFPLAVVEGKAVFVGDELWFDFDKSPTKVSEIHNLTSNGWSWNPPKPKTVIVELQREDAEFIIRVYGDCSIGSNAGNCVKACRKALEEK